MAQALLGASSPLRLNSRPWLLQLSSLHLFNPYSSPFSTSLRRGRRNALRPAITLPPNNNDEDDANPSDVPTKKSRNELKREARRSIKWGMELSKFSAPQIKRVLRAAALDEDVFDALMLVKRLGPDVREGKRRQFSYIGRLLREAEPELMEALIQTSKDGDISRVHALSGEESIPIEDNVEEDDTTNDDEEEGCEDHIEVASRWFDGLIYKEQTITNEVYSIHNVEFDRQELRKLVRRVQSIQESLNNEESDAQSNSKLTGAKKPLICFLRSLAKKSLAE